MLKCLLDEPHADRRSFRDTLFLFREASKRLSSEEGEDPLTTSAFLVIANQLQVSSMQ